MAYKNVNETYRDYLLNILTDEMAVVKTTRAGMTIGNSGEIMKFNLAQGVPLMNTKRLFTRGVVHEVAWFLNGPAPDGNLHIDYLLDNQCHFWTGNLFDSYNTRTGFKAAKYSPEWNAAYETFQKNLADPEFRALEGSLGRPYSAQWRTWRTNKANTLEQQAAYIAANENWIQSGSEKVRAHKLATVTEHAKFQTLDQLAKGLDEIRSSSDSRRIIIESWRPDELAGMALPPCHKHFQVIVMNGRLDIAMCQRSCDSFLGVPFNIPSYAIIGMWFAEIAGLKPGIFTHFLTDTHIYCGDHQQGAWYKDNFAELQARVRDAAASSDRTKFLDIREWIFEKSPKGVIKPGVENLDHVTGVLTQLANDPNQHPLATLEIKVDRNKSSKELLDTVKFEDFKITGYDEKAYQFIGRKMPV